MLSDRLSYPALELPTLVLNASWQSINACTVREAIVDVSRGRANVLHPIEYTLHGMDSWMSMPVGKDEPQIRTVHGPVKVPEIIVTTEYNKMRSFSVVFSRRNLWKRDNFTCQYCGCRPRQDEITVDHMMPRSRGGKSTWINCVLACVKCNKFKDNRTPEEAHMRPFRWVKNSSGVMVKEYYKTPKAPMWSPLYSVRRQHIPASWSAFIKQKIDELYWDSELEP